MAFGYKLKTFNSELMLRLSSQRSRVLQGFFFNGF